MIRVLMALALIYWKWPHKWYGQLSAALLLALSAVSVITTIARQEWTSLLVMFGLCAAVMSVGPAIHWYARRVDHRELLGLIEDLKRTRSMRNASGQSAASPVNRL